jgi:hypothetical protein
MTHDLMRARVSQICKGYWSKSFSPVVIMWNFHSSKKNVDSVSKKKCRQGIYKVLLVYGEIDYERMF